MGFFSRNKNDNKSNAIDEVINDREIVVYRDGVFEVFEDTANGKKYGRILKYHGAQKLVDMSEEEFLLWKDASENFGKYRITYERDEDFYIEKAVIELATSREAFEKPEPAPELSVPILSPEEREYRENLIRFYNSAIQSEDSGEKMLENASLDEAFSTAALADGKIRELAAKARQQSPEGEKKIKVTIPGALARLSERSKKKLYELVLETDELYVICSSHTGCQHSASGNAMIALSKEVADSVLGELSTKHAVFVKPIERQSISAEIHDIMMNGFSGIRFMHKYGGAVVIQISSKALKEKTLFPENIEYRAYTIAFFQDMRDGVPHEKLKKVELSMYDSMFRGRFVQPCLRKKDESGREYISLAVVTTPDGENLLDLYSSIENLEKADSYRSFRQSSPENSGYRTVTFSDIMRDIESQANPSCGFVIDRNRNSFPYRGKAFQNVKNLYEIWKKGGDSFGTPEQRESNNADNTPKE